MKNLTLIACTAVFIGGPLFCNPTLGAEPTQQRVWTATNGKTVDGAVTAIEGDKAVLKRADGAVVKVPLNIFVMDDLALLREHFGLDSADPAAEVKGSNADAAGDLPHPAGEVVGPIEAGASSHYFLYLSKSLKQGRKAPMMFYTPAPGGSAESLKELVNAAERGGWILGVSVESSNDLGYPKSTAACVAAVKHMLETLPIDKKRIHFMGDSGGGAQAMENSAHIRAAGVMPWVTYKAAPGKPNADYFYIIGGAKDLSIRIWERIG